MPALDVCLVHDLYDAVGARLGAARRERGLTQYQVAEAAGVSRATVANLEGGQQRVPLHLYVALCQVLCVDPAVVLGDTSETVRPIVRPLVGRVPAGDPRLDHVRTRLQGAARRANALLGALPDASA